MADQMTKSELERQRQRQAIASATLNVRARGVSCRADRCAYVLVGRFGEADGPALIRS